MHLSIVIPTYNEEKQIADLLRLLIKQTAGLEQSHIIVVDGQSTDHTVEEVGQFDVSCYCSDKKGRAAQMNAGAKHAKGDVLYFVHADCRPPDTFSDDIRDAVNSGSRAGCFRTSFDSDHPLLKINAYCTRFQSLMCRGGDQTLFINKNLFNQLNGFKEDYIIMEDYDLIQRIRREVKFRIIPKEVTVSARKYANNGYLTVQLANLVVFMMYRFDCSQQQMINTYKQMISHPKF